jgi:hypothetical protein
MQIMSKRNLSSSCVLNVESFFNDMSLLNYRINALNYITRKDCLPDEMPVFSQVKCWLSAGSVRNSGNDHHSKALGWGSKRRYQTAIQFQNSLLEAR